MESYHLNILYVLDKISDLNFQNDVWVRQAYWDRVLNFGEAVNTLDDFCFFDEIESGTIFLSDPNDQIQLELFVKDLLEYEESDDPKDMLLDSKWIEITRISLRLKRLFEAKWSGNH